MRAQHPESRSGVFMWLALAVCIGYANALNGSFQFDDYNVIVNEPRVQSWSAWFAALGSGIRPLLKFSYTLNWTLGTRAAGFHVTNLLIHWLNAFLVYRLAQNFVQQQWQHNSMHPVPLLAALLFAVHPVHTEAVSYICGRSASLMTLFYLAALLSYVTGRIRDNRIYIYVATPVLFLLALGVKETAMTFPFALLLWEAGCGGRWPRAFKQQWPVWALALVAALYFIFSNSYFSLMQHSAELGNLYSTPATNLNGFAWLLRQWAVPLWLNIDPDLPQLAGLSEALLPLLLFTGLFTLMLACWRRRPWISFALAWAMLQLIPLYLFLPRFDIANERQLYLAGWPLLLAAGIELSLWLNDKALRVVAAALVLGFISLTISRNQAYADEISLWQDTVRKSPRKARVHNNLGHAYLLANQYDAARREFTAALELDPRLYQAHYNLLRADSEASQPAARQIDPSLHIPAASSH